MKARLHKGLSKRAWIIIIISVIALLLVAYVVLSANAWKSMETASNKASADLKASIDTTLATETPPTSVPTAIQKTLDDYHASVPANPCELAPIYNWQANLPWLKDNKAACEEKVATAQKATAALESLLNFIKTDDAVASKLTETINTTATSADYTASSTAWTTLASDALLTENADFKPVGEKIKTSATTIAAAYTALVTAAKSEDKTTFDNAEKQLNATYATLDDAKTESTSVHTTLVAAVVNSYEKL